ncbi:hypothetical protein, partial [Candidatus Symbiopectobacterium sp. NZEC135]|uniref:hypothetical protein n=1 Tax=Candidatus Symbiopectobacterium sp. NZEC135 TaxID=2820471 RepID=UPI002227B22F
HCVTSAWIRLAHRFDGFFDVGHTYLFLFLLVVTLTGWVVYPALYGFVAKTRQKMVVLFSKISMRS